MPSTPLDLSGSEIIVEEPEEPEEEEVPVEDEPGRGLSEVTGAVVGAPEGEGFPWWLIVLAAIVLGGIFGTWYYRRRTRI